jgi:hypothetical protein
MLSDIDHIRQIIWRVRLLRKGNLRDDRDIPDLKRETQRLLDEIAAYQADLRRRAA